jgi:hypothetical protein
MLDLGTLELGPETRIAGRVVDQEGKPFQGLLEIGTVDTATRAVAMNQTMRFACGSDGAFTIIELGGGEYVVRTVTKSFSDEPLAAASPNRLVSTRGGSVEGVELVVVPLGRLLVRAQRDDQGSLRYQALDAQGLERAEGRLRGTQQTTIPLPHGPYRVRVLDGEGVILLEREVVVGDEPAAVDIPME